MSELQWDKRTCEGFASEWIAEIFSILEVNNDRGRVVQGCFILKIICMGL